MPFEHNNGYGSIFRVKQKKQENHADYQGSATVNNVPCWVNGWIKQGEDGPYLSLSFKPKEQRAEQRTEQQKQTSPTDGIVGMSDDIPF